MADAATPTLNSNYGYIKDRVYYAHGLPIEGVTMTSEDLTPGSTVHPTPAYAMGSTSMHTVAAALALMGFLLDP